MKAGGGGELPCLPEEEQVPVPYCWLCLRGWNRGTGGTLNQHSPSVQLGNATETSSQTLPVSHCQARSLAQKPGSQWVQGGILWPGAWLSHVGRPTMSCAGSKEIGPRPWLSGGIEAVLKQGAFIEHPYICPDGTPQQASLGNGLCLLSRNKHMMTIPWGCQSQRKLRPREGSCLIQGHISDFEDPNSQYPILGNFP